MSDCFLKSPSCGFEREGKTLSHILTELPAAHRHNLTYDSSLSVTKFFLFVNNEKITYLQKFVDLVEGNIPRNSHIRKKSGPRTVA